jgi:hypothetical protein
VIGALRGWLSKIGVRALVGFGLLLSLLISLVWWLNQFAGRAASPWLGSTTFLALLLGWLLARSRLSGWLATTLSATVGLFVVVGLSGKLFGPLLALARAAVALSGAVRHWQPGQPIPDPSLALLLAQDLGARATELTQRAWGWVMSFSRGAPGFDPLAAGLVWGGLLWFAAVWAAWGVRRWNEPLLAVLPAATILAASLAFARAQLLYMLPMFGCMVGLLTWRQYASRAGQWERQGVDCATDIPFDLSLWAGAIVVGVGGLALLAATPSPHQAVRFARSLLVPRSQTAEALGEVLGLSPGAGQSGLPGAPGVLPRQHLIGSGPELSQRVVYLARVISSPGDGGYYWRMLSYDRYDGRGWKTSLTEAMRFPAAGGPALSVGQSNDIWIEQEVRVLGGLELQLVQIGELVSLDQPFEIDLRPAPPGELDPFGARAQQPPSAGDYRATSRLSVPSPQALAAAGYDYPLWIAARYLELPPNLPPRLQELARQITAGIAAPYDRARAIETYLRQFPYTLDLPAPPPGRDVVDYYLFDLRQGYCDYAATAMAVLARLVGLPSRLVVGYAPGYYDPSTEQIVISEAEAHSWPEIYFSGVGWVAFEPTSGLPLAKLPAAPSGLVSPGPATLSPAPARVAPRDLIWPALMLLAVLALSIWGWQRWRSLRRGGVRALARLYAGLRRQARRLGASDWPGLTPCELAVSVGMQAGRLTLPGRWGKMIAPTGDEAQHLAALYARAIYSPHAPGPVEVREAQQVWRKLRWRLWLIGLARYRRAWHRDG